ncbi:hypothetical protein SDC9_110087 [bioreactor metagenome]|uniref:Uncharacterized protein n=1 Tax=bioreactor metagenome TaxID=1076179 RepID=A0A645BD10_9ZZZZ
MVRYIVPILVNEVEMGIYHGQRLIAVVIRMEGHARLKQEAVAALQFMFAMTGKRQAASAAKDEPQIEILERAALQIPHPVALAEMLAQRIDMDAVFFMKYHKSTNIFLDRAIFKQVSS